ncbi:Hypothetical predicted protein, partial [Pelobates cultripes]
SELRRAVASIREDSEFNVLMDEIGCNLMSSEEPLEEPNDSPQNDCSSVVFCQLNENGRKLCITDPTTGETKTYNLLPDSEGQYPCQLSDSEITENWAELSGMLLGGGQRPKASPGCIYPKVPTWTSLGNQNGTWVAAELPASQELAIWSSAHQATLTSVPMICASPPALPLCQQHPQPRLQTKLQPRLQTKLQPRLLSSYSVRSILSLDDLFTEIALSLVSATATTLVSATTTSLFACQSLTLNIISVEGRGGQSPIWSSLCQAKHQLVPCPPSFGPAEMIPERTQEVFQQWEKGCIVSAEPALTPFGRSWHLAWNQWPQQQRSHTGFLTQEDAEGSGHNTSKPNMAEMSTTGNNGCEKEQHSIMPTSKLVLLYCTGGAKGAATHPVFK